MNTEDIALEYIERFGSSIADAMSDAESITFLYADSDGAIYKRLKTDRRLQIVYISEEEWSVYCVVTINKTYAKPFVTHSGVWST